MTLEFGMRCAERLLLWLQPFCERLEVAGSIRRRCPQVNDIDLVAIPKVDATTDLFGQVTGMRNLLEDEIHRRIEAEKWSWIKHGDQFLEWDARGITVDLWQARGENFGTVLLCRTGSREHNIYLANRARDMGGRWLTTHGLMLFGQTYSATEHTIYRALGMRYFEPEERSANGGVGSAEWGAQSAECGVRDGIPLEDGARAFDTCDEVTR